MCARDDAGGTNENAEDPGKRAVPAPCAARGRQSRASSSPSAAMASSTALLRLGAIEEQGQHGLAVFALDGHLHAREQR